MKDILDIRELMQQPATTSTGSLTLADLDALLEQMFESENDAPSYQFAISVRRYQQVRYLFNRGQRVIRRKQIIRRQHRSTARRRRKGLA